MYFRLDVGFPDINEMKCLIVLLYIAVASASHHVHARSQEEREELPEELWREMEGFEGYEEAYEAEDRVVSNSFR